MFYCVSGHWVSMCMCASILFVCLRKSKQGEGSINNDSFLQNYSKFSEFVCVSVRVCVYKICVCVLPGSVTHVSQCFRFLLVHALNQSIF